MQIHQDIEVEDLEFLFSARMREISESGTDKVLMHMLGVNPETGTSNVGIEENLPTFEETTFDSQEIHKLKMLSFGSDYKDLKDEYEEKDAEITLKFNEAHNRLSNDELSQSKLKRELAVKGRELSNLEQRIKTILDKIRLKETDNPASLRALLTTLRNSYDKLLREVENKIKESESLKTSIEIYREQKSRYLKESDELGAEFEKKKKELETQELNPAKIVKCNFRNSKYTLGKNMNEQDFLKAQCECGEVNVFKYMEVPYYIGGDLGDFEERETLQYNDKKESRVSLLLESLFYHTIRRVRVPKKICVKCNRQLFFPFYTLERLAELGNYNDEEALTYIKRQGDVLNKYTITLSTKHVSELIDPDLVFEKEEDSEESIFIKRIASDKYVYRGMISAEILERYAGRKLDRHELDLTRQELEDHKYLITQELKRIQKSQGNQKVKDLIKGRTHIIYLYALFNRKDPLEIREILNSNKNKPEALINHLNDFIINELINAVIEGKPLYIFHETGTKPIAFTDKKLPHRTFIKCYKEPLKIIFKHSLSKTGTGIEMLNELIDKFRDVGASDYIISFSRSNKIVEFLKTSLDEKGFGTERMKQFFENYLKTKPHTDNEIEGTYFEWFVDMLNMTGKLNNETAFKDKDAYIPKIKEEFFDEEQEINLETIISDNIEEEI